jgi:hypothetical protein
MKEHRAMPDHRNFNARQKIVGLSWDDLEKSLAAPAGTRSTPSANQELKDYFGPEEYESLRSLATRPAFAAWRRGRIESNPVFLPGIMGSDPTTTMAARHRIWVNLWLVTAGSKTSNSCPTESASKTQNSRHRHRLR